MVVWWWWCGGFFTDYNTTPTKVVLSCFGLLVGLWQFGDPSWVDLFWPKDGEKEMCINQNINQVINC